MVIHGDQTGGDRGQWTMDIQVSNFETILSLFYGDAIRLEWAKLHTFGNHLPQIYRYNIDIHMKFRRNVRVFEDCW